MESTLLDILKEFLKAALSIVTSMIIEKWKNRRKIKKKKL